MDRRVDHGRYPSPATLGFLHADPEHLPLAGAVVLLAYIPAAMLAKPELLAVLKGTLMPSLQFNREFLSLLVAVIGTTLSAYLYTWQSNEEVEEEIAMGRTRLSERQGATREELRQTRWDIVIRMRFSNVVMYFIMLSTASTLHPAGATEISTAVEAAQALEPLAGPRACSSPSASWQSASSLCPS